MLQNNVNMLSCLKCKGQVSCSHGSSPDSRTRLFFYLDQYKTLLTKVCKTGNKNCNVTLLVQYNMVATVQYAPHTNTSFQYFQPWYRSKLVVLVGTR